MDIKTGVFTVITSGYYIITYRWFTKFVIIVFVIKPSQMYSASARVRPGEATDMYINRNGELIEESRWLTMMASDGSAAYIDDQGSRTVVGSIFQKSEPGLSSLSLHVTYDTHLISPIFGSLFNIQFK